MIVSTKSYISYRNRQDRNPHYQPGPAYEALEAFLDKHLSESQSLEAEELVMELIEEIRKESFLAGQNAIKN